MRIDGSQMRLIGVYFLCLAYFIAGWNGVITTWSAVILYIVVDAAIVAYFKKGE